MISDRAARRLVEVAAETIRRAPDAFSEVLDEITAPIYATDVAGTLTYFNPACVELAGRIPKVGDDKWCVTWRIYTLGGEHLPHDCCPMAVAIRERRPIRGVQAIAERPDGSRVMFAPFPTPIFDDEGTLIGAVNLLSDVSDEHWSGHRSNGPTRDPELRMANIEALARIATRIAGQDPDGRATIRYGDFVAFDDAMWRYPDFLVRAEAAYGLLESFDLPNACPEEKPN